MNYVKELFQKYFIPEFIELVAMEERQDDSRWMIRKGYKTDFHRDKKGFMSGGDLTQSGKKFIVECNKKSDILFKKIEKMPLEAESTVKKLFLEYIRKHPDVDYRKDLSDDEKRVCDRLLRTF